MLKKDKSIIKFIVLIILCIFAIITLMPKTYAGVTTPTPDQKIQFRAVELRENNGEKQLIVEAWIQNLDFKGIDLRLQYDSSLLSLSDLETNEKISINDPLTIPGNFEFCNNFEQFMEIAEYNKEDGELRLIFSNLTEDEVTETSDYYIVDEKIGEYIHITDYVLIGRFSFQVGEGDITEQSIALKEAETSPTTGIKINIDGQGNYYEEQSIFEFVLELESNNAYLSDIVLSTGEVDEENPENSTYKEYDLTPEFDKGTFTYNVEILEYIDKMNLKITKDYEKSTIIMKVPKRDENDNLMYEDDGTTIVYQEYEITDSNNLTQEVLTEFVLNKLGEPDTIIELKVMAEDGYTTNTYQIIIKRPYGTIKGTIQYDMIEQNENPDIDKTTDLNFYKTGRFNWNELKDIFGQIYENPATYDDLDELDKDLYMTSNADGTYEIYLIPGSYDLQIDKRGFLDFIITNIEVTDGAVINLGNRILTAGDVNRDRSNRIGRYSRSCGTYGCYYRRC